MKKNASSDRQKQPLAAVNTAPTATAARPPERLSDFLCTPYQEMSNGRARLATHRVEDKSDIER